MERGNILETTEGIYSWNNLSYYQYTHPHIQASVKIRHIDAL